MPGWTFFALKPRIPYSLGLGALGASHFSRIKTYFPGVFQTGKPWNQVQYLWVAYLVAAISGCALLLILGYLVHLHCRPITNLQGLNEGLGARSQQKYRDPTDRQLWPWMTNLCRTEVGGPGLMLHFNFLAAALQLQKV